MVRVTWWPPSLLGIAGSRCCIVVVPGPGGCRRFLGFGLAVGFLGSISASFQTLVCQRVRDQAAYAVIDSINLVSCRLKEKRIRF